MLRVGNMGDELRLLGRLASILSEDLTVRGDHEQRPYRISGQYMWVREASVHFDLKRINTAARGSPVRFNAVTTSVTLFSRGLYVSPYLLVLWFSIIRGETTRSRDPRRNSANQSHSISTARLENGTIPASHRRLASNPTQDVS